MQKVVQFGAGNIGRGFTAQLFTESGYEVVFIDVVEEVVRQLNRRRSYPIEIAGPGAEIITVTNVRAVNGKDTDAVASEIRDASLVCTAVGVNVLRQIAAPLAKGIRLRADEGITQPLNIIICENLLHASGVLKGYILNDIPSEYSEYVEKNIGFVESSVGRMVPVMTVEQRQKDPLLVVVEAYKELPVDRRGFRGEIPNIVGMKPKDNFEGYVERKLFAHNLGHAVSAYLGYLRGHEYIWQAMGDPKVIGIVRKALAETGVALIKRHGFTPEEHQAHIEDLLRRFANVALGDTVARVGKDPIRKLGPNDRLVGGAKAALECGVTPTHVCAGIAAALLFKNSEDDAAMRIQDMITEGGIDRVLREICEIEQTSEMARLVHNQYDTLKSGGWPE